MNDVGNRTQWRTQAVQRHRGVEENGMVGNQGLLGNEDAE